MIPCLWALVACTADGDSSAPVWSMVAAGDINACGLSSEGKLACWGDVDDCGVNEPPDGTFTRVAVGQAACAIDTDQALQCWGGALGDSCRYMDELDHPPSGRFADVATMTCYACAVDVDGSLSCWGCPELWDDPPAGAFRQVSVGTGAACAVGIDGTLSCWGPRDPISAWDMEHLPDGTDFIAVRCTGDTGETKAACAALQANGLLVLGYVDPESPNQPPDGSYSDLTAGDAVCAVATDGTHIDCFGNSMWGGHYDWRPPYQDAWAQVSGMRDRDCALTRRGALTCEGPYMDDVPGVP